MKVLVDKLPESPKQCVFSKFVPMGYYICTLRPYIEKVACKPECLCKDVKKCDRLKEIGE